MNKQQILRNSLRIMEDVQSKVVSMRSSPKQYRQSISFNNNRSLDESSHRKISTLFESIDYRNAKYQGFLSEPSIIVPNGSANNSPTRKSSATPIQRHGLGILLTDSMQFILSHWKQDKIDSNTVIIERNGDYLFGEWQNGKANGPMVMKVDEVIILAVYKQGKLMAKGKKGEYFMIIDTLKKTILVLKQNKKQIDKTNQNGDLLPLTIVEFTHLFTDKKPSEQKNLQHQANLYQKMRKNYKREARSGSKSKSKSKDRKQASPFDDENIEQVIKKYSQKYEMGVKSSHYSFQRFLASYLIPEISQVERLKRRKRRVDTFRSPTPRIRINSHQDYQLDSISLFNIQNSLEMLTPVSSKKKTLAPESLIYKKLDFISGKQLKTAPKIQYYYFGFQNGLGIKFILPNSISTGNFAKKLKDGPRLSSMGIHNNTFKIQDIGVKYYENKCIQQGNFKSKQTLTYENSVFRPQAKLSAIYQKYHKKSIFFMNEYFTNLSQDQDNITLKILPSTKEFYLEHARYILDECYNETKKITQLQQNQQLFKLMQQKRVGKCHTPSRPKRKKASRQIHLFSDKNSITPKSNISSMVSLTPNQSNNRYAALIQKKENEQRASVSKSQSKKVKANIKADTQKKSFPTKKAGVSVSAIQPVINENVQSEGYLSQSLPPDSALQLLKSKNGQLKDKIQKVKYEIEYPQTVHVAPQKKKEDNKSKKIVDTSQSLKNKKQSTSSQIKNKVVVKNSNKKSSSPISKVKSSKSEGKYIKKKQEVTKATVAVSTESPPKQLMPHHDTATKQQISPSELIKLKSVSQRVLYKQIYKDGISFNKNHNANSPAKKSKKHKYLQESLEESLNANLKSVQPKQLSKKQKNEKFRHYISSNINKGIEKQAEYQRQKENEESIRAQLLGMSVDQLEKKLVQESMKQNYVEQNLFRSSPRRIDRQSSRRRGKKQNAHFTHESSPKLEGARDHHQDLDNQFTLNNNNNHHLELQVLSFQEHSSILKKNNTSRSMIKEQYQQDSQQPKFGTLFENRQRNHRVILPDLKQSNISQKTPLSPSNRRACLPETPKRLEQNLIEKRLRILREYKEMNKKKDGGSQQNKSPLSPSNHNSKQSVRHMARHADRSYNHHQKDRQYTQQYKQIENRHSPYVLQYNKRLQQNSRNLTSAQPTLSSVPMRENMNKYGVDNKLSLPVARQLIGYGQPGVNLQKEYIKHHKIYSKRNNLLEEEYAAQNRKIALSENNNQCDLDRRYPLKSQIPFPSKQYGKTLIDQCHQQPTLKQNDKAALDNLKNQKKYQYYFDA